MEKTGISYLIITLGKPKVFTIIVTSPIKTSYHDCLHKLEGHTTATGILMYWYDIPVDDAPRC